MSNLYRLLITILFYTTASAQQFVNDNFENNAAMGDRVNLSNKVFNALVSGNIALVVWVADEPTRLDTCSVELKT